MTTIIRCLILTSIILISFNIKAQNTSSINVYGNCGMCKDRIETAAKEVIGVTSAEWDSETQSLLITSESFFQIDKLHQKLASVGHDTDLAKASQEVYDNMHGCCKYRVDEEIKPEAVPQSGKADELAIRVYGNCGMCKDRIENAAKSIIGVTTATWEAETQILVVSIGAFFLESDLHQKLAEIGHDTDQAKASQEVYDNMHGCCKYRVDEAHTGENHIYNVNGIEDDNQKIQYAHYLGDGHDHESKVSGMIYEQSPNGSLNPIIGANVFWSGTTVGASTDLDGFFELDPRLSDPLLVVSYVGYRNDTIDMTDQKMVAITLTSNHILNEVEIKYRKKSTEISFINPIKVQSIGQKELCKAACCNLSESFETNPSVDVSMTDAVTGTRKIQMLGLAGPNIQVMRENMPYIRGLAAVVGMEYTPGAWIEGIQLNQGTGSVVNGPESITGQINVELKKPQQSERLYLNLFANAASRVEANLNVSQKVNDKWSTGLLLHSKIQKNEIDRNNDGFLDQPLFDQFIGINRWRYKGENGLIGQFGIKGTFIDTQAGQLTPPSDQAYWNSNMKTSRMETWAKIGKVFEDRPYASIGFQLSAMTHDQESSFSSPPSNSRNYNATHKNFYANLIYQSIIDNTDHTIKFGASYQLDNIEEDVSLQGSFKRTEHLPGIFTEYQFRPNDKWTIVAGLRGDYHNLWGAFVTPRLHVKFAPSETSAFRFAAGRGQRTAYIFAENIGLFASNRSIEFGEDYAYPSQAETAWNIGLNYTKEFNFSGKNAVWGVDYYYTKFTKQTVVDWDQSPQAVFFYQLDGNSRSNSIQTQLDIELKKGIDLRVAYRFNDPKTQFTEGFNRNPLTSYHRAFANVGWEIGKGWIWDGTVNWQGSKRIPNTSSNPEVYQLDTTSPSFATLNMQISKTFKANLDFYIGGENILNYKQENPIISGDQPFNDYFDASLIWGPILGSNYYFGMRYKIF